MCAVRVLRTIRKAEYAEVAALFFLQSAAMSMWTVPLSTILSVHHLGKITPYAFASTALAAFVSPLIFGAMADRQTPPAKVLRGLSIATAVAMALSSLAVQLGWNQWIVLAIIQLNALCFAPTNGILAAIVFAKLSDAQKEFGPLRAMGTIGWIAGCCVISLLNADASPMAGYSGAAVWLIVCAFTFFLPAVEMPKSIARLSWHERLGLDALKLLKNRDHRVVFITVALFNIPLAGFFPYAPPHLRDLGFKYTTAWMSFGQMTEIIAMFSLGTLLLKWRLKWIFLSGLGFGVLRFAFSAMNTPATLLIGITLHGASYTLVFITAQIYLDQRIAVAWRARAQSLMLLMTSGVGNLIGYLGNGWWFDLCAKPAGTRWTLFWAGLSLTAAAVGIYFAIAYHGKGVPPGRQREA
jgi:nucleoside transporter